MATRNENMTPWKATHPGCILGYELEERAISQKDFAIMIGMQRSHLNELIKGKRPLNKPTAEKIESILGISAITLLNLQTQYNDCMRAAEHNNPIHHHLHIETLLNLLQLQRKLSAPTCFQSGTERHLLLLPYSILPRLPYRPVPLFLHILFR